MHRVLCYAAFSHCSAPPRRRGRANSGNPDEQCYWCIRDAIYADVKLINHLEANPDVDEAREGPADPRGARRHSSLARLARSGAGYEGRTVLLRAQAALYPLSHLQIIV